MNIPTLVDATDLCNWADRLDARSLLPQVVRRVLHGTVNSIRQIDFPSGEGIQRPGWDGILDVEKGNSFVPDGASGWELSVRDDSRTKADEDYQKRITDPLGLDPASTAFVFVTLRRWSMKEKWAKERQSENIWREVRVYDADDLEQWLEQAPVVHIWLSTLLGKHPGNVIDLSSFWAEWSRATVPALSTHLFTVGRENEIKSLREWLLGDPDILTMQADSRDEAIAFLSACFHELPIEEQTHFLSRSVVVNDSVALRSLASSGSRLILIPRFEAGDAIINAINGRHHIFLPLGKGDSSSPSTIQIPRLHRDHALKAFLELGMNFEQATDLAHLGRRSLMALRRKLSKAQGTPAWSTPAEGHSLLPILLIGGWNDAQQGDRELVARLARAPYEQINTTLTCWANESDPPVRRVGNTWLLASKEDAWSLLSKYLTRDVLDLFESIALEVLSEIDPKFDLPADQRWMARVFVNPPVHSDLLREGLAETLALMGSRSDITRFADATSGQHRASHVVQRLLKHANDDWRCWDTLTPLLSLLAEAAPDEFLTAVEEGIAGEQPVLAKLFEETKGAIIASSPHWGLLNALEVLAWHTDYLARSALVLARLDILDPGGQLANRPGNSLREILLPWNPQTTASLIERLGVLDLLRKRQPRAAWKLLCQLVPPFYSSHPTRAPRWREWDLDSQEQNNHFDESEWTHEIISRLLIDASDGPQWKMLVEMIDNVPEDSRSLILDHLIKLDLISLSGESCLSIYEGLRRVVDLQYRLSASDTYKTKALPNEFQDKLQSLYVRFQPTNLIDRLGWLFSNELVPPIPYSVGNDWETRQLAAIKMRLDAIDVIYTAGGLQTILEMSNHVENPFCLGLSLGDTKFLETEEESVLIQHLGSDDASLTALAQGYIKQRADTAGWQWIEDQFGRLVRDSFIPRQQAEYFICLPFGSRCWDLLSTMTKETQNLYWSHVRPTSSNADDRIRAIKLFLDHERPYAALNLIALNLDTQTSGTDIPLTIVADVLERAMKYSPEQFFNPQMLDLYVSQLLDLLETSSEIGQGRIAALEWAWLPLLGHERRGPKILYFELARNPDFFVDLLTLMFRADGEDTNDVSEEKAQQARHAYHLLSNWSQVPGTQTDGSIDIAALRDWVAKARETAKAVGRGKVCDEYIGQILACAPKDIDGTWPPEAVREVIDEASNEELDRGFMVRIMNNRGLVTKSIAEGGGQERQLMDMYRNYVQRIGLRWPRTAKLLTQIANYYSDKARSEDNRAELDEDLLR